MTRTFFIPAALALAVTLPAVPAQAAGAPRTFLSAAGSDANNCTNVSTPCRHMAAAYAATAPNGEIYVLDPANYGSLTITHGVSIEGHGWASIAPVAGQAAITINAPGATDKINIIGVVLDGTAIASTTGIQFNSGGSLTVRDSVIRNFTGDGILFTPNTLSPSQLFVSNTLISDNGGDGIDIQPAGTGAVNAVLSRVDLEGNSTVGLFAESLGPTINITFSDSVASSTGIGITASDEGGPVIIMVRNSTIANNIRGLEVDNAGAIIRVTRSTITGNTTAWAVFASGVVLSYGDNNIDGNTNINTEPPNPLIYK
jgi:hypothetical protein